MVRVRLIMFAALLLAFAGALPTAVRAQGDDTELVTRLTDEQRRIYADWKQARAAFDQIHEAYWRDIDARKAERRRKRNAGIAFSPADFVMQQPPKYTGPALRPDIAKLMADLKPPVPETPIPLVPEVVELAKQHYRFVPRLASEREFKQSYAAEALAVGLSKDQVVRVYALETGGRGTYDMQAGFDPETRKGRAISTAVGYAQLLAANSIDELVRHGDGFVSRLGLLAANPSTPRERAAELVAKIDALKAMMKVARSVPREWSAHVRLSQTPAGAAIHAINLDADIGPWLQVLKLKGLKDIAEKAGRMTLSGAEIELMNLSGPRTGLEMMEPVAANAATANFFSQGGYYRNGIVREKTAAELLVALDKRMNDNIVKAGSIEFAAAFDEVSSGQPTRLVQAGGAVPSAPPQSIFPPPAQLMAPPRAAADTAPRMQWAPRDLSDRVHRTPVTEAN